MTIVGLVFGLLIGTALEWYMLRVILLEETGFTFPVRFPWPHVAAVAVLVALSEVTAGLGPALRASRMWIPEALAHE
jgi:putative ABC transport system permease protein